MNIIIFGPQGCGKGTQADILAEKYGLHHLSMGDALRSEIKKKSTLGKKVEKIVNAGKLVPHQVTDEIASKVISKYKTGVIFDGYPRNNEQLKYLDSNISMHLAIEISLPKKESIRRISARRMCPKCGKNYNLIWTKPKKSGMCDVCGSHLMQRIDDKPLEIQRRLEIYKKDTEPLKKYYKKLGILHIIDGNQSIQKVARDIASIITNYFAKSKTLS